MPPTQGRSLQVRLRLGHFCGSGGDNSFVNQKDDLYSIREDGSDMTLLAPKMQGNRSPSVCRDGRHIIFESASDGQRNIWRILGKRQEEKQIAG